MKRKIFLRCIIIVFLSLVVIIGVAEQLQADVSSGIVRLHIIANSDESFDQRVKLVVRDAVIAEQGVIFPDGIQGELTNGEKEKLLQVVKKALKEHGVHYGAVLETGNYYFPTKKYENLTLPAGNYDAVRIVLGDGAGKNWWCVMYPPLCFTESAVGKVDEKSTDILKESMSEFEYEIISEESIKTVPAFKLVEIWSRFKENFKDFL